MNQLSELPSVSRLLSDAEVTALVDIHGQAVVTQLVRFHEYAHALFHLGVDQQTNAALAQAYLENNPARIPLLC